ncbi:MAG: sensor histidine kinase [Clostridia bacterium]
MKGLFFQYVRAKRRALILALGCLLLCTLVFSLYNLPREATLYALTLCVALAGVGACVDFARFARRHEELLRCFAAIGDELGTLPEPDNLIERDHQALLLALERARVQGVTDMDIKRRDMIDYYTLWAHQVKTPIAAMRILLSAGECDQALMGEQLFKVEEYVNLALSYLRITDGTNDLVIRRVKLDDVVRAAVRKYAPLFIRQKIALRYEGVSLCVLTDEKWLQFVLEQLLSNALKYTRKGAVSIYLSGALALAIRDTGIGIAPEDLARVGEKGYTGYNGREDKRSSGLGLYLSRQVLEKLSHRMRITSQVGVGTVVTIAFSEEEAVCE